MTTSILNTLNLIATGFVLGFMPVLIIYAVKTTIKRIKEEMKL